METIGILGGMGSYATCDLFRRILDAFPGEKEWDRPRILIDNNCTMPSRVRAILYGEKWEQLIREMSESVRHLVEAGAEQIPLGCMTAHYFREYLPCQDRIMDALAGTRRQMAICYALGTEVTCLCTEGSMEAGIWEKALPGFFVRYPGKARMRQLRTFIEAVKQHQVTPEVQQKFVHFVEDQSGQCVLLGCTELPLLLEGMRFGREVVDPIDCAIQHLRSVC